MARVDAPRNLPLLLALLAAMASGCEKRNGKLVFVVPSWVNPRPPATQPTDAELINLLRPRSIRIHPFTGTRTFDQAGGIKGIEVRIEALDAYEDSVKAFGDFRFELFTFRPASPDPKGERINTWETSLLDAKANAIHWDKVHRNYQFRLRWDRPIPVGQKFVLAAVFASPYSDRLFDQRVFVCGE